MKISSFNILNHNQLDGIGSNDHHQKFTINDHLVTDHGNCNGIPKPGIPNGYAPLDDNLKIPLEYVNVTGSGLIYSGDWNPNSGSYPSNPVDNSYWIVIQDGTFDGIQWIEGDWLVYINFSLGWTKISLNQDGVISVNNKIGNVQLTLDDIPDGVNRKLLQINDTNVNNINVWSSQKINDYVNNLIDNNITQKKIQIDSQINNLHPNVLSVNGYTGGVNLSIGDLLYVNLDGIQPGQILKWDGNNFSPSDDLTDNTSGVLPDLTPYTGSGNRAIIIGGYMYDIYERVNFSQYVDISTPMNAIRFGNISLSFSNSNMATSNSLFNKIVHFDNNNNLYSINNIMSLSDTNHFGSTSSIYSDSVLESNGTGNIGLISGGIQNYYSNNAETSIYSFNINSYSSASLYANMIEGKARHSSASNNSNNLCIFSGGFTGTLLHDSRKISLFNIQNGGTSQNFGNIDYAEVRSLTSCGNSINNRCLIMGGSTSYNTINVNNISYVTITNLSNSVAYATLIKKSREFDCASNGTNNRCLISGVLARDGSGWQYPTYAYSKTEYISFYNQSQAQEFGFLINDIISGSMTSNG